MFSTVVIQLFPTCHRSDGSSEGRPADRRRVKCLITEIIVRRNQDVVYIAVEAWKGSKPGTYWHLICCLSTGFDGNIQILELRPLAVLHTRDV